ncbi:MAG TPA: phosphoenolpyruvate synthase [Chitinophaga sp.]|uniref:phosphoenolpyruvate synthase n=1 Tax=Chitinophaga sp. TaxID=1869181 RepID=UPI002C08F0B1|nr:phosphoenolpyruvate synthase [Chitinophaga sp.]HVI44108.1 phosphoenolpyruvate synthase [Chitinophaga sp.]
MKTMNTRILDFREADRAMLAMVGGKGANLGELLKMKDVHVPEGFCITTAVYKEVVGNNTAVNSLLDQLATLKADNRNAISETAAEIRSVIESISMAPDIADDMAGYLAKFDDGQAFAVRSSATAEDLPTASFAGQQDTYLNIISKDAILKHISRCWASLYTDRAIIYRMQNGFDHRKVSLSVAVQKMIFPEVAGIMFTADPVTADRKVVSIDASFGLGEALVSGIVNADNYKVRNSEVTDKKIPGKKLAVYALQDGGTKEKGIAPELQYKQALTDEQILQLERLGRRIEEHFGCPQDIEWCLANDTFYMLQSRPITTLYPIPTANDKEYHVYVSVGHQQMMTDPMKPLGLSLWQLTSIRPMAIAAGRLFVDVTEELVSPTKRNIILNVLGKSDLLVKDALTTVVERNGFIKLLPGDEQTPGSEDKPLVNYLALTDYDPSVVTDLIKRSEIAIEELKQRIQTKSGPDLIDFIIEDTRLSRKQIFDAQSIEVIMTAMNAASWINDKMKEWLNEKNVADTLSQSVSNNITSEMGLALLDVADVIRPYPELIAYLQQAKDDNFPDDLLRFEGGQEVRDAVYAYLNKYGMRCPGEIDITRTRWSEKPDTLVAFMLTNIRNFEPGASKRKFEQGKKEALNKEQELLERLAQLPDGEEKVKETKRMINLVRNLGGYREYPKYDMVNRYFIYKLALLKEAEKLLQAGVIVEAEDIYYLTFEELREVISTSQLDYQIISKRKDDYRTYEKLKPPRVITSDGEVISGQYKRDNLPVGAIVGLPVSSGVIEGRARVILNMADADLAEGDILVTAFTDPSWTPLFVSIKGLITEVGGLMTHGAVIAREYGLPAVVGMENATRLIKDGQRIRLNGTDGYVEIL